MGLEEIKAKVIDEARTKAEARVATARREADSIRARGAVDAEDLERRLLRRARQDAEARKERRITDARLASRKTVLAEKQAVSDDVFGSALDAFAASGDEFRSALRQALLNAVETGEEALALPRADRDAWGTTFIEKLNRELSAQGRKGTIRLAEKVPDLTSGAVLLGHGVEVNLSSDLMIRQVREQLEERVAHLLFGEEDSAKAGG